LALKAREDQKKKGWEREVDMTRVLVTEKGLLVRTAETVTGKDLVIEEGLKEDRWQQEMALEEESELYMSSIFSAIVFVGLLFQFRSVSLSNRSIRCTYSMASCFMSTEQDLLDDSP